MIICQSVFLSLWCICATINYIFISFNNIACDCCKTVCFLADIKRKEEALESNHTDKSERILLQNQF